MKLSLAVTGLITLLVSASCSAITLKLDPQIDLLVLDGRKFQAPSSKVQTAWSWTAVSISFCFG